MDGGVDWIDLAQCREKWQALVHVVMKGEKVNRTLFWWRNIKERGR